MQTKKRSCMDTENPAAVAGSEKGKGNMNENENEKRK